MLILCCLWLPCRTGSLVVTLWPLFPALSTWDWPQGPLQTGPPFEPIVLGINPSPRRTLIVLQQNDLSWGWGGGSVDKNTCHISTRTQVPHLSCKSWPGQRACVIQSRGSRDRKIPGARGLLARPLSRSVSSWISEALSREARCRVIN